MGCAGACGLAALPTGFFTDGYGMRLLAEAMEADLPYEIDCAAVLICGEKDRAGSAKSFNRRWAKKEGLQVYWIRDAGHNSNTDKPEEVDQIIRDFVRSIPFQNGGYPDYCKKDSQ